MQQKVKCRIWTSQGGGALVAGQRLLPARGHHVRADRLHAVRHAQSFLRQRADDRHDHRSCRRSVCGRRELCQRAGFRQRTPARDLTGLCLRGWSEQGSVAQQSRGLMVRMVPKYRDGADEGSTLEVTTHTPCDAAAG